MKTHSKYLEKMLAGVVFAALLLTGCGSAVKTQGEAALEDTGVMETVVRPPKEIRDLTEAYDVILTGATKEFLAGYPVDDAYLMWLTAEYGEEKILQIAYAVLDGEQDEDTWYEMIGNSIHVLWLLYCQNVGLGQDMLKNVVWTECNREDEIVISFAGDFNLAEDWYTMEHYNETKSDIYQCVSPELMRMMQDSDILMMNNEFVYSNGGEAIPGKAYTFRANPERIQILEEFGADIVSLGNNHTYDFGQEGLLDTLDELDEAGIPYLGAGRDLDEAKKIVYFVANGKKIAFVAATEIERTKNYTKEATEHSAGVLKTLYPQTFCEVIEEAARYSDYVIAVPHWGSEGTLYPDASQLRLAKLYEAAGADVIIGGHPHRLQGAGFINETPVAYSIGNFWFSTGTLYTTLAQVVIDADGSLTLKFLPCEQKDLTTSLITDKTEKDEFYHYIAAISSNIGIDAAGNVYNTKETEKAFLYDSADSTTSVRGGRDNDGFTIDIVGNRIE